MAEAAVEHDHAPARFDAIIIGAGIAGMYQLHRLRQLGLSVRVFETGGDVGGTWYWNRYPGARFDSESWTYGYSFSEALLQEWDWSEHFSAQPETLRYLNHVAEKFDLRRDIQFNAQVTAAHYQDDWGGWEIELADGGRHRATFLITAIGPLSAHTLPRIEGRDSFAGRAFHTARWPHEPVDFSGQRVGIIGTGATGIQTIQTIAKTVGHLTVFQRTANWAAPLHNTPISAAEMAEIKANYPRIFARCRETPGCFIHMNDPRATFEVSEDERLAFYEELYSKPGF
ncbi:MAG: flavin-containing monooxygenase, partial [Thalassobaculaceae bacterium]